LRQHIDDGLLLPSIPVVSRPALSASSFGLALNRRRRSSPSNWLTVADFFDWGNLSKNLSSIALYESTRQTIITGDQKKDKPLSPKLWSKHHQAIRFSDGQRPQRHGVEYAEHRCGGLAAALAIHHTSMGNIQLFDPREGTLAIVAQRGFGMDFLDHFRALGAFLNYLQTVYPTSRPS
jgi:hypothetical protein